MYKYLTLIYCICLISFCARAKQCSHTIFGTSGKCSDAISLSLAETPAFTINSPSIVRDATVNMSELLISCIVNSNVTCNGGNNGSASVNASGGTSPYSYNWSNGVTTASNSNLIAGIYSVIVTDALGAMDTCNLALTEPALLVVNMIGSNASCGLSNGSIDAMISGGTPAYLYNWNNGETTEDLMALLPGTYTLVITDFNGCSISGSTSIVDTGTAFAIADILDTLIACGGEEIGLLGSIGGTASLGTWVGGLGQFPDGIHNLTGSYFPDPSEFGTSFPLLLITDDPPGLCPADTDTVIITILMPPYLEPILPFVACGGSFDLSTVSLVDTNNAVGQLYFYDSFPLTSPLTNTLISSSGIYYVLKVTNTTPSCFDIVSVDITIDPAINPGASVQDPGCAGGLGTILLNPTGGTGSFTYLWSDNSTDNFLQAPAGTYTVIVTDSLACSDTSQITITQPPPTTVAIWTGAVDNDWNNSGNWICGVPDATKDVIIPTGTITCMVLAGQNGICNTLIIETGANLFVHPNGKLEVVY